MRRWFRSRRRLQLELEQLAQQLEDRGAQVVELRVGQLVLQRCTVAELELLARWVIDLDQLEPSLGPVVVLRPAQELAP